MQALLDHRLEEPGLGGLGARGGDLLGRDCLHHRVVRADGDRLHGHFHRVREVGRRRTHDVQLHRRLVGEHDHAGRVGHRLVYDL